MGMHHPIIERRRSPHGMEITNRGKLCVEMNAKAKQALRGGRAVHPRNACCIQRAACNGHCQWPLNTGRRLPTRREPFDHRHQLIDLFARVVERQRRPHRRLERRSAAGSAARSGGRRARRCPRRSAPAPTSSVVVAVQHERQHAGLVARRADQPQARDRLQARCVAYAEQLVLVARRCSRCRCARRSRAPRPGPTASAMLPVPASNVPAAAWYTSSRR